MLIPRSPLSDPNSQELLSQTPIGNKYFVENPHRVLATIDIIEWSPLYVDDKFLIMELSLGLLGGTTCLTLLV